MVFTFQIEKRQIKGNTHLFFIVDLPPWAEHWSWSKLHTLMWRCISRADDAWRKLLCMQNRFSAKPHGWALHDSDSLCRIYGADQLIPGRMSHWFHLVADFVTSLWVVPLFDHLQTTFNLNCMSKAQPPWSCTMDHNCLTALCSRDQQHSKMSGY